MVIKLRARNHHFWRMFNFYWLVLLGSCISFIKKSESGINPRIQNQGWNSCLALVMTAWLSFVWILASIDCFSLGVNLQRRVAHFTAARLLKLSSRYSCTNFLSNLKKLARGFQYIRWRMLVHFLIFYDFIVPLYQRCGRFESLTK